jgi:membrane protein DedA with SNARE-associated domain
VHLVAASITDTLVTFATNVIKDLGLPGVFLLMLAESACIPIPSEATMLFAGFNVSTGHDTLLGVTAAGVLGNLVGSWVAYGVGWFGRTELLEERLHVKRRHLDQADRWFERYGSAAVFFSRLLPIVRTFISLPAGAARMPFGRFTALTLAGCIPWVLALAIIGRQVGSHWTRWRDHLHYFDLAVGALVVLAIVALAVRWWRGRGATPAADAAAG